jgi:hypothetical protein
MSPYTSNILAIKRRLEGAPGAPIGLSAAELAFNQVDDTLYYGFSSLDTNTVTSVAIAGSGAFVSLQGNQTIYGHKTFNGDITFNNPVSFQNSDFNFGNFASYNSLSSLGIATLSATNFVGDNVVVNASTVTTLVSTVPTDDKSNKAASTAYVHGLVDAINSSLAGGLVDTTTTQTINGVKTFGSNTNFNGNTTFTGAVTLSSTSLGHSRITELGDPEQPLDAVNKKYVDGIASSINIHPVVKAATVAELTPAVYTPVSDGLYDTLVWSSGLTINTFAPAAIDGVDLYIGDRILIKDQSYLPYNGVYAVSAFNVGSYGNITFQRTSDYNQSLPGEVAAGDYMFVTNGTVNNNHGYVLTTTTQWAELVIGVDPLSFVQFSGAGQIIAGTGIRKDGDTLSITDVGTAGTYLLNTTDAQGRVTAGSNPKALVALSAISMAARQLPLYTGTDSVCAIQLSNYGESLIATTNYNTASSILGLEDMAFQVSSNVKITGGTVDNLTINNSYIDAGTF